MDKALIEELGWKLHDKGLLENWDGLINCFMDLSTKNSVYENDKYICDWKIALLKAKAETKIK